MSDSEKKQLELDHRVKFTICDIDCSCTKSCVEQFKIFVSLS